MAQVAGVLPDDLATKIKNSKVLVVGAGGIGCEILKNLVMSGFPDIEIIDLDTIDVSNLNRQFLFHKEHVGKSKAEVARQSALNFNPNTNIKAYHDSVTSTNYGVNFFKRFDVVLNALDNRQARNHVNRMCLTADVPLIESGTSGYDGQIELIKKDLTMCYECTPKAPQKSFPGCTIRNTPSEPIHCIVWAKHLFNQLFGEDIEDQDVSPDTTDPEAAGEAGKEAMATNANEQGNVERVKTKDWARDVQYDPEKLFNKFFCDDIKYLLSMSDLWKKRTPPNPLQWNEITNNSTDCDNGGITRDQKIWTITECAKYFSEAITSLKLSALKLTEGDFLVWDKDDRDAMDFVAACANIRANIFGIPQKSCFEIKSMAGNIIPAIATTNAITAGFVVLHAFKVLEGKFDQCRTVYMKLRPNARNQLFIPEKFLNRPNPQCYVCAPNPSVTLTVDTSKMTVKTLRDEVLIKALNMISPDVTLESKGLIVISSDGDETECNNDKKLNEMQIVDGCILTVDDFFQNYTLVVTIVHKEVERDEAPFELSADPSTLKPQEPTEDITTATDEPETKKRKIDETVSDVKVEDDDDDCAIVEDDDDCCIVDTKNNSNDGASCSNHSAVEDVGEPSSKRIRLASSSSDDCVVLD